jgi:hypothetical protein
MPLVLMVAILGALANIEGVPATLSLRVQNKG